MTWQRRAAAEALALLLDDLDPTVQVFVTPPATVNAPAYIVGYPTTVEYDLPSFGIDRATQPIAAVGGVGEVDKVDAMLRAAKVAIETTPNLGGAVQVCRVQTQTNWRVLSVRGAELLFADLVLEIRM